MACFLSFIYPGIALTLHCLHIKVKGTVSFIPQTRLYNLFASILKITSIFDAKPKHLQQCSNCTEQKIQDLFSSSVAK